MEARDLTSYIDVAMIVVVARGRFQDTRDLVELRWCLSKPVAAIIRLCLAILPYAMVDGARPGKISIPLITAAARFCRNLVAH